MIHKFIIFAGVHNFGSLSLNTADKKYEGLFQHFQEFKRISLYENDTYFSRCPSSLMIYYAAHDPRGPFTDMV